jgi:RecA-family ATPase
MMRQVDSFKPSVVIVDPVSSFLTGSAPLDVQAMMIR